MVNDDHYVPGTCNIGPAEIERRRRAGWIGASVTAVAWLGLLILQVHPLWYLLLTFPAAAAATGFLQAYLHFCAHFGLQGLFNFDSRIGQTEQVSRIDFQRADRRKAWQIIWTAMAIGFGVSLVALVIRSYPKNTGEAK